MAAEALHRNEAEALQRTLAATVAGGEVQKINGRAAYREGLRSLDSGDEASWRIRNAEVDFAKDTGVTFSEGDDVYWDASANKAVNPGLALDGSADFYVGRCVKAAASGDTSVRVDLNAPSRYERLCPIVYEFDCDGDNGDTNKHVLIPTDQNPHGLLILGVYGIVTEVFAGSTQDQGIVTVEDEDDTALSTLTASNAAGDAVGDVIIGTNAVIGGTTGDAVKSVAAGKAVQGYVSQQTSGGTPAGKIKVYLVVLPLV